MCAIGLLAPHRVAQFCPLYCLRHSSLTRFRVPMRICQVRPSNFYTTAHEKLFLDTNSRLGLLFWPDLPRHFYFL